MSPTIAITVFEISTGQNVGAAKMTTAPAANDRQGDDHRATLAVRRVDGAPGRRLRDQAQQTAGGRHPADLGLAPMLLGDEEDVEVRPERAAHIREQEVQRIERPGAERMSWPRSEVGDKGDPGAHQHSAKHAPNVEAMHLHAE